MLNFLDILFMSTLVALLAQMQVKIYRIPNSPYHPYFGQDSIGTIKGSHRCRKQAIYENIRLMVIRPISSTTCLQRPDLHKETTKTSRQSEMSGFESKITALGIIHLALNGLSDLPM